MQCQPYIARRVNRSTISGFQISVARCSQTPFTVPGSRERKLRPADLDPHKASVKQELLFLLFFQCCLDL